MLLFLLLGACAPATGPGDAGFAAGTDSGSTHAETTAGDSGVTGDGGSADGGSGTDTGTTGDGGTASDGGAAVAAVPDLPTSGCGLAAYDWLPFDQVGRLVTVEEAPELAYDLDTINAILALADFAHLPAPSYGVRAWRVRYTTQDKGRLVEATGLLALPDTGGDAALPIALWNHPTMGFNDACAPSNQGVMGAAYALLLASHGFAVTAPDYLGMAGFGEPSDQLHPWIVAEPTAIASLDGVRALLSFLDERAEDFGVQATADPSRVVILGASEGGFASLWADRYQGAYLPEVQVTGVVAGIPATDPLALGTIGATTTSDTTRAVAAALASMAAWYGTAKPLSQVVQAPFDETLPEAMATSCSDWEQAFQAADEPGEIYAEAYLQAAAAGGDWAEAYPPWSCYLGEAVVRDSKVPRQGDAPVLLVTGELDQLAWPEPAHADVTALCGQGYRIEHLQCAGADHAGAALAAMPQMLSWAITAGTGADPTVAAETCVVAAPSECSPVE